MTEPRPAFRFAVLRPPDDDEVCQDPVNEWVRTMKHEPGNQLPIVFDETTALTATTLEAAKAEAAAIWDAMEAAGSLWGIVEMPSYGRCKAEGYTIVDRRDYCVASVYVRGRYAPRHRDIDPRQPKLPGFGI